MPEPAAIGGDFTLMDPYGHSRTQTALLGHWSIVYFGFTHCPDICPLGLATITQALAQLGPQGTKIQPIFITLDPERDTAEVLKSYLSGFSPRWLGLRGSVEQTREATAAYKVYAAREETPDSALGYTINHSGFIYLMGPDGRYRTHFRHDDTAITMAETLRRQLSSEH